MKIDATAKITFGEFRIGAPHKPTNLDFWVRTHLQLLARRRRRAQAWRCFFFAGQPIAHATGSLGSEATGRASTFLAGATLLAGSGRAKDEGRSGPRQTVGVDGAIGFAAPFFFLTPTAFCRTPHSRCTTA